MFSYPRFVVAGLFTLGLLLVGCSSSGDDAIDTTTSQSFPDLSEFNKQNEATTTSSVVSTTAAPTLEEAKAEIEVFMHDENRKLHECINVARECDALVQLAEIHIDRQLEASIGLANDLVREGLEIQSPIDPTHDRYEIEEIDLPSATSTSAVVTFCDIDGHIVYQPGGAPDGTDLIINDKVVSRIKIANLTRNTEGRWRVSDSVEREQFPNGDGCDQ